MAVVVGAAPLVPPVALVPVVLGAEDEVVPLVAEVVAEVVAGEEVLVPAGEIVGALVEQAVSAAPSGTSTRAMTDFFMAVTPGQGDSTGSNRTVRGRARAEGAAEPIQFPAGYRGVEQTGVVPPLEIPWPAQPPAYGRVLLCPYDPAYEAGDLAMLRDLATDPYVPQKGTLPPGADEEQARAYVERQRGRDREGRGLMFVVADQNDPARALGFAALWAKALGEGRANIGYAVAPRHRGQGLAADAIAALLGFAWTIPVIHRVEAYVEPWNAASWRSCERAGLAREGLLRSHQEIGGSRRDMLLYAAIRP